MMKIVFQDQVIGLDGIYLHQVLNFWLDGDNRIHERLKYTKDRNSKWIKSLLSP